MRSLIVALCLLAATPAFAQDNCVPVATAVEHMRQHPMTASVHVALPAEAKLAVDILNAMPPETDEHYTVVIFATATSGAGLLLLGNDDAVCQNLPVPPDMWRAFVRSVRGETS